MHKSAMFHADVFFKTYCSDFSGGLILDIGSQDINGSLRDVAPAQMQYIGIDFVAGKNVDVIMTDPYKLPFEDGSVDVVVSSSCFEHSEMFWVLFLEIARVLKPGGFFYLNVPSNGVFHRYPVDCWRFYPDSGGALATWAARNGLAVTLLESFIGAQESMAEGWNDFVAVFGIAPVKERNSESYIWDKCGNTSNIRLPKRDKLVNESLYSEDQKRANLFASQIESIKNEHEITKAHLHRLENSHSEKK